MKKIRTIEAAVFEEKKLKVCAYVRVSTDQAEQKNSFSAQMEHYTAYIKNNPIWTFAGIYADQALSGKNAAKRPDFQRMVKDAENRNLTSSSRSPSVVSLGIPPIVWKPCANLNSLELIFSLKRKTSTP